MRKLLRFVAALAMIASFQFGPAALAQEAMSSGNAGQALLTVDETLHQANGALVATVHVGVGRLVPGDHLLALWKPGDNGYVPTRALRLLDIRVNEQDVFVPLDAVLGVYDPNRFRLTVDGDGFVLTIEAADASESYGVALYFDARVISRREVYSLLAPESREVFRYDYETVVIE